MRSSDTEIVQTSVYLPKWLHKALKNEATEAELRVNTLIVEDLAQRYPDKAIFFGLTPELSLTGKTETSLSNR